MQKIKEMLRQAQQSSKKIKVNQLQTNFKIFSVNMIFMIVFHNVLNLLSLAFCLPACPAYRQTGGRQVVFFEIYELNRLNSSLPK
jgi:hypothetical protein